MNGDGRSLEVLALEPYDTGSHRCVRESLSRWSRHRWRWFTRPGRGWKWRMRLAAVELIDLARSRGAFDEPIDVIVATSLLGAADLRGLLPAGWRETPIVLYMHENQATYPWSGNSKVDRERDVHFAVTNLTSVLAADLVIFNSLWNKESLLRGLKSILRRAAAVELGDWGRQVAETSRVIWPPVEPPPAELKAAIAAKIDGADSGPALHNTVNVVWPHRWEHDKGPQELLEIAGRFSDSLDLRWTILGWRFPECPPALAEFERRFADRIDHIGYEPDRGRYWEHLVRCDWVLSTARHEFFGIGVVEALLAGCLPWLPDRLSYRELLPEQARGLSPVKPPADPRGLRRAIQSHLEPALAPRAVERIDQAIEEAVEAAGR